MRSLKLDTPKLPSQPRVSGRPTVSTPPRSGGIVPPAKTVPPRVGDGFERPTQSAGKRGGSVFEPGRPTSPKSPVGAKGSIGGKLMLSPEIMDSLKKVGTDTAAKLGASAKRSEVRQSLMDAIKGMDLGSSSKGLFRKAYNVAYRAYQAACVSSASGLRPQPTE